MPTDATYTIVYNIQNNILIEIETKDIEFALYLAVEKKQVFNSEVIRIQELVQLYIAHANTLFLEK